MLEVRRDHPVLGMGDFEVVDAENPSVLAYLRRGMDYDEDGHEDIVLCVNNLSRFAQPAELQLTHMAGKQPIELQGRVPFPLVGELPFFITLPPYGFFWFALVDPSPVVAQ
jgi:maltose alpha-D-glucosyltransferase/alpha-amylase